jgi:phosphoribosylformylglycinamidine (FGAM) synthase-like enzyme
MVGLVRDIDHITTQGFKSEGDTIILLGETKPELGGSEFQYVIHGVTEGRPPTIDLDVEATMQNALLGAIRNGWIASAHDLSEGGIAVALTESCISGELGADVTILTELRNDIALFSESQSRVIISVKPELATKVSEWFAVKGVPHHVIGQVKGKHITIKVNETAVIQTPVEQLEKIWKDAIPCHMG